MTKRPLFLTGVAAIALAGVQRLAGEIDRARHSASVSRPGDLTRLSIRYFLTGPFGGFGSFVRTRSDVREYAVETSRGGQQAATLRAIIYCPGYRTVLLTEPALAERRGGTVSIALERLGWVSLSGRLISMPDPRGLTIEAIYLASWGHAFFGIADGTVVSFTVATTKVAADGSFGLNVPDFARDPVVTSFDEGLSRGVLRLIAREPQTGNIPYVLEDIQQAGKEVNLPIAAEYPQDLALVGVLR